MGALEPGSPNPVAAKRAGLRGGEPASSLLIFLFLIFLATLTGEVRKALGVWLTPCPP